ncbi:SIMPL domain-containing protein [Novosphingobium sp. 9]|uniref:SIMPL domain-containing protein n=1 Tax=Novosphingobium sp. 9 TaxID=2025349 RepID=UPI0021B525BC|nr:SIMPL domain-containing protein [Novosphingobium sp. 9]
MKSTIALLMALPTLALATTAQAQTEPPQPQILVSATGIARTAPDRVTIGYTVRGEGTTSDTAITKLRDSALRIEGGVRNLAKDADLHTSDLNVAEIRPKECDANNYGTQRLSEGPCAVIGYVATMPVQVETGDVDDAGTLTGLISRLGGTYVGISRFSLHDDNAARAKALAQALADARNQAQMIADGSGRKLGPLLRVQDGDYRNVAPELMVTAMRAGEAPPPPPPPAPPAPIKVGMKPAPIETSARIMVSYALQ